MKGEDSDEGDWKPPPDVKRPVGRPRKKTNSKSAGPSPGRATTIASPTTPPLSQRRKLSTSPLSPRFAAAASLPDLRDASSPTSSPSKRCRRDVLRDAAASVYAGTGHYPVIFTGTVFYNTPPHFSPTLPDFQSMENLSSTPTESQSPLECRSRPNPQLNAYEQAAFPTDPQPRSHYPNTDPHSFHFNPILPIAQPQHSGFTPHLSSERGRTLSASTSVPCPRTRLPVAIPRIRRSHLRASLQHSSRPQSWTLLPAATRPTSSSNKPSM